MSQIHAAKVMKNAATGEWEARAYNSIGKRLPEADYFTTDKADAFRTAGIMAKWTVEPRRGGASDLGVTETRRTAGYNIERTKGRTDKPEYTIRYADGSYGPATDAFYSLYAIQGNGCQQIGNYRTLTAAEAAQEAHAAPKATEAPKLRRPLLEFYLVARQSGLPAATCLLAAKLYSHIPHAGPSDFDWCIQQSYNWPQRAAKIVEALTHTQS